MSLRKSVVAAPRRIFQVGRNDPCPCDSGEKYKNCCIKKGESFLKKMARKEQKRIYKEAKKQSKTNSS